MNITQENTGDLSATIKVELTPEDYSEKVKHSLTEMQKKANMPGFRPGKVPFGLVKKMYGKSAMAEEVNKIITDSLNNYIKENKLEILGYPIGNSEKGKDIDFEQEGDYEFYFDIGLVPEVNLELSDKIGVRFKESYPNGTVIFVRIKLNICFKAYFRTWAWLDLCWLPNCS